MAERGPGPGPDQPAVKAPEPPARESMPGRGDPRGVLRQAFLRGGRAQIVVGLLCAVLGFGLVAQIEATSEDSLLRTARTADLVRLLDDLGQREQRLVVEREDLERTLDDLSSGVDSGAAALREAQDRVRILGVLAGTVPDSGPGVVMRVEDPSQRVSAAVVLDTVQELRDAGAQSIQIADVRVVASTSFIDGPGDGELRIDGQSVVRPFTVRAVGDAATMDTALSIPGGAVDAIETAGGSAVIAQRESVEIDALRELSPPRYARPVPMS